MPDGKLVADDAGHWMLIASKVGDEKKIAALTAAARHYGIYVGKPLFLSGHRPISDEEFENQKARQAAGMVPDEYDLGSMIDQYKYEKEHG